MNLFFWLEELCIWKKEHHLNGICWLYVNSICWNTDGQILQSRWYLHVHLLLPSAFSVQNLYEPLSYRVILSHNSPQYKNCFLILQLCELCLSTTAVRSQGLCTHPRAMFMSLRWPHSSKSLALMDVAANVHVTSDVEEGIRICFKSCMFIHQH